MTKKPEKTKHFSSEELLEADRQFDTLYDENIETPTEYLERKRSRDMYKLILYIMENELDKIKKDIFVRIFFYGEKICDISEDTGLQPSTIYKHYDKALKTIRKSLKYVQVYQNACRKDKMMPIEKMRDGAFLALKNFSSHTISMRLSRLMERENIGQGELCRFLEIDERRFREFFYGKILPDAGEIVSLAGFFGVSTDYILKGDLS